MKANIERYFELEEKAQKSTLTKVEQDELNRLNKNFMDKALIEKTLENDGIQLNNSSVKSRLDEAFDKRFNSSQSVKQNNVIPINQGVLRLFSPPINWAAVASVAAVFMVFFMLRPSETPKHNNPLLADTAIHHGADTTNIPTDTLLY